MRSLRVARPAFAIATAAALSLSLGRAAAAQENYEIQVYGSETMPAHSTMFELHSNFTVNGRRGLSDDGEFPTNHAIHETLEITHGFNDWSELGFYWFTSVPRGGNWDWVGTHIRPRVRVPESWGWPVGVSISQEFGWSKAQFSGDTWTYEFRPIIDKQLDRWYVAFNPALEKSLRGPNANKPFEFAPALNVGYDVTKQVNLAVEYYGGYGPVTGFDPAAEQEHQLFFATNLNLAPRWEFNLGYGTALTAGGDKKIVKMILGRRVGGKD
ncbi:MAG TPA: hypothetical protein VHB25_03370 [Gemmatimonadaceae bacterium]|nr:hypothetical protein [Gemmatimonadaceae bacterium]